MVRKFEKEKMNSLISVIVPMYNCEQYIEKCVNSIIHQKHVSVEVIIVDDHSSDRSAIICEEIQKIHPNVRLIKNNETLGPSATRNKGIEVAKGKYLAFVDGDDYLDLDCFSYLIEKSKKYSSDIEIIDFLVEEENGTVIVMNQDAEQIVCIDENYDLFKNYARKTVCGMLIKRELIFSNEKKASVQFDPTVFSGEDLLFFVEILSKARCCHFSSKGAPRYHYVQHSCSSTHQFSFDKVFTSIDAEKRVARIIRESGGINAGNCARRVLVYRCYKIFKDLRENNGKKSEWNRLLHEMRALDLFVILQRFPVRFKIRWIMMSRLCL